MMEINIPERILKLFISDEELKDKKKYEIAIKPKQREIFKIYRDKLNEISKIGG